LAWIHFSMIYGKRDPHLHCTERSEVHVSAAAQPQDDGDPVTTPNE
jgi:hypothetical protein